MTDSGVSVMSTVEAKGLLDGIFGGNKGGTGGKIGLDQIFKLAKLLPLLQELAASASGDLATVPGMTALVTSAVRLAEAGVALTESTNDDAIVATLKKFAADPNAIAMLAKFYAAYASKRVSGMAYAMSGEDTTELTAAGFDPTILLQLLPLLMELFVAFRKKKPVPA